MPAGGRPQVAQIEPQVSAFFFYLPPGKDMGLDPRQNALGISGFRGKYGDPVLCGDLVGILGEGSIMCSGLFLTEEGKNVLGTGETGLLVETLCFVL